MDAFKIEAAQTVNQCGLAIRKFSVKLDQFRGKNHYLKVGMVSKIASNYYECILSKDEKYKLVERAFNENIKTFVELGKLVNPINVDKLLDKIKLTTKQFEGYTTQLSEINKRFLELKPTQKCDEESPKNMSSFLNEFLQVVEFVLLNLKRLQNNFKK